jgi:hypothetical protein
MDKMSKRELFKKWSKTNDGFQYLKEWHKQKQLKRRKTIEIKRRNSTNWRSVDYSTTPWMRMINNPQINDSTTREGKRFRRRFRLPFPVFEYIVELCKERNIFEIKNYERITIPIEIKVLICLRIFSRGECLDTLYELTGVSEAYCSTIFKQFSKNFRQQFQQQFLPIPSESDIKKSMEAYDDLGIPGTIGSVDVTHVHWDKCPVRHTMLCTGKEGYPTLAYQAVVDHAGKLLHITPGFFGAMNDKNITNFDKFLSDVRYQRLYQDIEYEMYDYDGKITKYKGIHFICDGGYNKESYLIDPYQFRSDSAIIYWSEWLESIRKDVECFFGRFKGRFQFFKDSIQLPNNIDIDNVMFCCCR